MCDNPRSLKFVEEKYRRMDMLGEPHIRPLTEYVEQLMANSKLCVPYFDPCDGGVNAKILFLFEKPGPQTDRANGGSGFISRDNNDPTAAATYKFMIDAQLERKDTVIWNCIPWWNGMIALTAAEREAGREQIGPLLGLLPKIRTVVLVGRTAGRAQPKIEALRAVEPLRARLHIILSDHPSPLVYANFPERWQRIPCVWHQASWT